MDDVAGQHRLRIDQRGPAVVRHAQAENDLGAARHLLGLVQRGGEARAGRQIAPGGEGTQHRMARETRAGNLDVVEETHASRAAQGRKSAEREGGERASAATAENCDRRAVDIGRVVIAGPGPCS